MNKYIKKSLSLSIGALLSTAAYANTTYTYSVDGDNLLTTTVDGVTYEYQLAADYATITGSQNLAGSYSNTIFDNVASTSAPDSALRIASTSAVVSGVFIGNDSASSSNNGAGAIYLNSNGKLATISGLFVGNTNTIGGGAISLDNTAATASSITGTFVNNTGGTGGAIYNQGTISALSGTFIGNSATTNGGAIFNTVNGTITITTNGADTEFTGNTVKGASNAIYNAGTINFKSTIGDDDDYYSVIVNDAITGTTAGKLNITGGVTEFNNTVGNQIITVASTAILDLGSTTVNGTDYTANLSTSSSLTVNGTLSLSLSDLGTIELCDVTFNSDSALVLDMSDIFGDFSLDITIVDGSSLDTFTVYLDDGSSESISLADGDYDLSSDYYSTLSISSVTSSTGTTFTISGTAVPEPSTYAMIFGVVALGFAAYRRRK